MIHLFRTAAIATLLGVIPVALGAQPKRLGQIQGLVFDSTRAAPLAGSRVEMIDANAPLRIWSTTSSARGEFVFDSLSSGTYLVSISHPRLDSLGVHTLAQGVAVKDGTGSRVRLAVPSPESLVRRVCGDSTTANESGYVRGVVRDADRQAVAVEGTVEIRWIDMAVQGLTVRREMSTARAGTDAEGRFVVCGVPRDGIVQLQAWSGRDSSGVVDITIPSDGVSSRDLYVGRHRTELLTVRDSSAAADTSAQITAPVRRGDAQIRGVVKRDNGAPLSGALLSIRGTGVEQRSGTDGTFTMTGLPTGTYTAEVRAIGYTPVRRIVNVVPGDGTTLDITLDKSAKLDTVRIMAQRGTLGQALFEQERRTSGLGHVFTADRLERDRPLRMADIFRMVPGIRVVPGMFGDMLVMRGASLEATCAPQVWIDGVLAMNDAPLDLFITPEQIVGAIAFTSAVSTPAQYAGGVSGCGAILLFTGDRRAALKR